MKKTDSSARSEDPSCPSLPQVVSTSKIALPIKRAPTSTSALPRPITGKKTPARKPVAISAKIAGPQELSKIPKRVPSKKKVKSHDSSVAVIQERSFEIHSVSRSSPLRNQVSLFELAFADEPASFHDLQTLDIAASSHETKTDSSRRPQSCFGRPLVSSFSLRSISESLRSEKLDSSLADLEENSEQIKSPDEDLIHELLPTLSSIPALGRPKPSSSRGKLLGWIRTHSRSISESLSKRSIRSYKEDLQEHVWVIASKNDFYEADS